MNENNHVLGSAVIIFDLKFTLAKKNEIVFNDNEIIASFGYANNQKCIDGINAMFEEKLDLAKKSEKIIEYMVDTCTELFGWRYQNSDLVKEWKLNLGRDYHTDYNRIHVCKYNIYSDDIDETTKSFKNIEMCITRSIVRLHFAITSDFYLIHKLYTLSNRCVLEKIVGFNKLKTFKFESSLFKVFNLYTCAKLIYMFLHEEIDF